MSYRAYASQLIDALMSQFVGQGNLEEIAKIHLSDMTVEVSPFRASLGRIALHGIPEDEEVKSSALKFDLDSLDFRALFRGLTAQLKGCLVMNGSDEACCKREPAYGERMTRPCVAPAVIRVQAAKEGQPIVVSGSHFGSSPGRLLVMNASSQLSTTIQSWTDTQIEALPTPVIPRGAYFLQVQSAEGLLSTAVPFHID